MKAVFGWLLVAFAYLYGLAAFVISKAIAGTICPNGLDLLLGGFLPTALSGFFGGRTLFSHCKRTGKSQWPMRVGIGILGILLSFELVFIARMYLSSGECMQYYKQMRRIEKPGQ